MIKLILSIFTLIAIITSLNAQIVNIPDANFKAYLVGNASINTNGDTEIQVSEASTYSGLINIGFSGISDLTGISEFINITELYCHNNNLTSLDVSNNTSLNRLNCGSNALTSLDVSNGNNINFTFFSAYNSNLTCIQVDDIVFSNANWTSIAPASGFSEDCSVSVGIETTNELDLNLYPNPVRNQLFLDLGKGQFTKLYIHNLRGELVKSITSINEVIDVSDLTPSIYILKLHTENGIATTKFLKQ